MSSLNAPLTTPPLLTPTSFPLYGRKLILARVIWLLITVFALSLVITGIPIRFEKVTMVDQDIRVPEFRNLIAVGVAPEVAATYDISVAVLLFLALFAGGILMFWRGSNSREAIILSLTLILLGASFSALGTTHRTTDAPFSQPLAGVLATILVFLQSASVVASGFWLPDGQFTPRWTGGLVVLYIILIAGLYSFVRFPQSHDLVNIIALPMTALVVWAQVYRYRRVASPIVRQQIKWAMVGIVVYCIGFALWQTTTLLLPNQEGLFPRVVGIIARIVLDLSAAALPVGFGVAILRYRLWDVDLTLNRSLVYGVVTVILALVFLGGGLALQGVLGQANSTIAFAISIAAAGLLFYPALQRAQRFVDRRLYGFRFDLNELNRAQQLPEVKSPGVLTGKTLGKYHVLGVIGKGGMGEVYQGEGDGQMVAIKILPEELAQQADFRKRFERESQILAALDHPNIVKFYGSGESDGVYYLVLEFIRGRELADIIREQGRIPFKAARPFVQDFAAALDYAHERGLVHRDIKPSNIMVRRKAHGEALEAVLMDFGIAKIQDAHTALTGTSAVGTINYMAPEQIMASKTVDLRADIYTLGVMVYEMLTGELPFKGNPAQVLFAHLQQPPIDPGQLVPDLPPDVAHSVMRALEKNPEDRFQSVGEFAVALSRT
jgi:predicted Ser/Thr protein kinase